jgi:transposase
MLWELSVVEQRYRAVLAAGAGVPVTEVAERYGVTCQSMHTWLVRYGRKGSRGWRTVITHPCPSVAYSRRGRGGDL